MSDLRVIDGPEIVAAFAEFGVEVIFDGESRGPSLNNYFIQPGKGVRVRTVMDLEQDVALRLGVDLKVTAIFGGPHMIAVQVPDPTPDTVRFADHIGDAEDEPLEVLLGVAEGGRTMFMNLREAPHLLVAGQTGSGKSVMLHSLICSVLSDRFDVELVLMDFKRVELSVYADSEHLKLPIITDVNDAVRALHWLTAKMDSRLQMLADLGFRNIVDLNNSPMAMESGVTLPYIVVVIDEVADLMLQKPEAQTPLVRLAQMARATGIHLVLATQRPTVNVLTGLIKANIPGRIAFAVKTRTDSQVILDQTGAEDLLGKGDMLYQEGGKAVVRIQGAFLSISEVADIVKAANANRSH